MSFKYCALSGYSSPDGISNPSACAIITYASPCNGDSGQIQGQVYASSTAALSALANFPANISATQAAWIAGGSVGDPPVTPVRPIATESFSCNVPYGSGFTLPSPSLPADLLAVWSTLSPTTQQQAALGFCLDTAVVADCMDGNLSSLGIDLGYKDLQALAASGVLDSRGISMSRFLGTNVS